MHVTEQMLGNLSNVRDNLADVVQWADEVILFLIIYLMLHVGMSSAL